MDWADGSREWKCLDVPKWKRPGVQSHEESGCAVAPSGHNATHVPVKEGSKSSAHSLCDDVEKAGVKKLLAKPENLGSAHESWSSTQLLCSWSRGPGRTRGTRCSAFAESSRSCGSTRPRTDAAATLWVCILVEYSLTLAVLDLPCATNVFPELCKLGISHPSGLLAAFRSAHEEPKKAAGLNTAEFFTQQGMDFTGRSIWPVTK